MYQVVVGFRETAVSADRSVCLGGYLRLSRRVSERSGSFRKIYLHTVIMMIT